MLFPILAIQLNGKILVGGNFSTFNGIGTYGSIIRLVGDLPRFSGENFSVSVGERVSSLKVANTFVVPSSDAPGQVPGSLCVNSGGSALLIRKPSGDVGSVVIV